MRTAEHLAWSRNARKHIRVDNGPESQSISSKGTANFGGATQRANLVQFTNEVGIKISSENNA
jgi:hypothetical protein